MSNIEIMSLTDKELEDSLIKVKVELEDIPNRTYGYPDDKVTDLSKATRILNLITEEQQRRDNIITTGTFKPYGHSEGRWSSGKITHETISNWWNNLTSSERVFIINYALDQMGYPSHQPNSLSYKKMISVIKSTSHKLFHNSIR